MTTRKHYSGLDLASKDLETLDSGTSHQDLRLWLRILTLHKLINNEVRRRLRRYFGMSLSRFDLLAQLDNTPSGIRVGELSKRMMVTTGNISGLTDELVVDGLVERTADPFNRRANLVRMTTKGRTLFREAAKINEKWIEDFFSNLSQSEKTLLFDLLEKQKHFVMTRLQDVRMVSEDTAGAK